MTKPWLKSFIYFILQVTSCKLYKKGQICRFGATWLVEMREPVFDLIKEGEPESGHLLNLISAKLLLTSRPRGSCSSQDRPSCPQPGNSQIGEEPLRFVFKKQDTGKENKIRLELVSLTTSLWFILNSHEFENTGVIISN